MCKNKYAYSVWGLTNLAREYMNDELAARKKGIDNGFSDWASATRDGD